MNEDQIRRLRDYPLFVEFQKYVEDKAEELNSTDGVEQMTDEQAGQEVRARAKARRKFQEIFAPFVDFREKREPTIAEIQSAKDRVAL